MPKHTPIVTLAALALAALLASCAAPHSTSNRVEMAVTENGFEPSSVPLTRGQPVTLVVTRRTDATCATAIVLADYGIKRDLPLNQAVEITFTPDKAGEVRYACGMDMIAGKFVVR
jgi:plastocyanin domain-containing protein